jgi:hypothetical protein
MDAYLIVVIYKYLIQLQRDVNVKLDLLEMVKIVFLLVLMDKSGIIMLVLVQMDMLELQEFVNNVHLDQLSMVKKQDVLVLTLIKYLQLINSHVLHVLQILHQIKINASVILDMLLMEDLVLEIVKIHNF